MILLDLMMPEMDGFQLVAEMQKHPVWRRIPVIVITARDLTMEDRARLNSGIELVMRKESFSPGQSYRASSPSGRQALKHTSSGGRFVTRILYVEDNDDNVYMLKMRFELLDGFEVLVAENGETGCERRRLNCRI